ncbi:unnamed protein product [Meganyctiphanes norvegica]|uniref:Reelin domain-containing protein n=1 Tax=Meganyctiphanes norvegica TaxID=48144 RepID=A0AAV2SJ70_MEGNR
MLRYSLILVGFLPLVLGYSNGGPGSACGNLLPQHHGMTVQRGTSLFSITLPGNTVQRGSETQLFLQGAGGETFKGFFVQGFEGTDGSSGVFQPSRNVQPRSCTGTENAATHTSPSEKSKVTLLWTAPNYATTVEFKSTVAVDKTTIHTNKPLSVNVV